MYAAYLKMYALYLQATKALCWEARKSHSMPLVASMEKLTVSPHQPAPIPRAVASVDLLTSPLSSSKSKLRRDRRKQSLARLADQLQVATSENLQEQSSLKRRHAEIAAKRVEVDETKVRIALAREKQRQTLFPPFASSPSYSSVLAPSLPVKLRASAPSSAPVPPPVVLDAAQSSCTSFKCYAPRWPGCSEVFCYRHCPHPRHEHPGYVVPPQPASRPIVEPVRSRRLPPPKPQPVRPLPPLWTDRADEYGDPGVDLEEQDRFNEKF